jgi:two-component system, NtrC family, response regulator AtoC
MIKKKLPQILVVDDEPNVGMIFHRILEQDGYEVVSASNGEECLRALKNINPRLVFLDLRMPGMDGLETLRRIRETHPSLPVVVMTAYKTITSAIESMKLGAFDYLVKPLDVEKLKVFVKQAFELSDMVSNSPALQKTPEAASLSADGVVAAGPEMTRVLDLIRRVAPTDVAVLILGESGTGKEVTARAIHNAGPRKAKPFVVVDCAALPESLIESELFGHEKGAFTGADASRAGKFESAGGGTLFLDEIGNLPLGVQAKLLRFLQEPVIERLGGRKGPTKLDVRILAATNADLEKSVRDGIFREDLYHRLKGFVIHLPPLRARGGKDLELLVDHILHEFMNKLGKKGLRVATETMEILKAYLWPGNIRELQNALRSAALLSDGMIRPAHLPMSIQTSQDRDAPKNTEALTSALAEVVRRVEKDRMADAIKACGGDHQRAAGSLGMETAIFMEKIKEYGLDG